MSSLADFSMQTDTAMEDLDKLLATRTVKEYEAVYQTVKPTLQAWDAAYDALTTRTKSMSRPLVSMYNGLWAKVQAHRTALAQDPQPLEGGRTRKWKKPRKMTRRYCKKTSCRKMGFSQKASCRPWKNCY